ALVISDLKMPGMSGMELLRKLRTDHPELTMIMITAFGSVETAVEAMRAGAYDYITKPIDYEALRLVVDRALERQRLLQEVQVLRSNLDRKYGFESIIGQAPALLRVLEIAARAARSDSTVLIRGETGTGKELLAKAVHRNSRRKDRPFVTINSGAIPADLIESELFGHVKGSFTGAIAHKTGKVEMADGGTLFLDEIGELPLSLQVKLLRLIQQGEIEKVGAGSASTVDVRIIAATHRNLQAMIEDGSFREDLYYRLAVIPLELPPLRERAEDIPELVQHLFLKAKQKHGREELKMPPSLIPLFSSYRWPGNVRELENVIERMTVLTTGDTVAAEDLPEVLSRERPSVDALQLELPPEGISLEGVEKELILRALRKFDWNQTHAARYLDISRRTLIYRMDKYDLRKDPGASSPQSG
ncbi:MAG TPA: sigma-54 dependent transcriptional regulator, partial [Bryobacteraceae bacterium]|nr:sigma-54 dependent transcriptional regulator [Bryobacteraceae bacterium]